MNQAITPILDDTATISLVDSVKGAKNGLEAFRLLYSGLNKGMAKYLDLESVKPLFEKNSKTLEELFIKVDTGEKFWIGDYYQDTDGLTVRRFNGKVEKVVKTDKGSVSKAIHEFLEKENVATHDRNIGKVKLADIKTPSLLNPAISSKALSAKDPIWFTQDQNHIVFDAKITVMGKPPSDRAKKLYAGFMKAKQDGWKIGYYKNSRFLYLYVLEKDGYVLTESGFNAFADSAKESDILDDTTTMQTSIQALKSQFHTNNGMGKIALARQILQARVNQVSKIHGFKKGDSFFKDDLYFQVTGINRGKAIHYDVMDIDSNGKLFKINEHSLSDDAFYNKFNGFESELPQQELSNAPSTDEILERNSQTSRNANSGNEKPVRNDGSANGTNASTPSATANQAGDQQQGDNRVPTDSPVIAGTQSDSSVVKGNGDYSPARTVDDTGSGDVSGSGISDDRQRNETVAGIAQGTKKLDRAVKLALQEQAEGIDYEPTEENIRATLPFLLPEQQDDIVKIEARFKDNHGMLITNGTGTGKTATALGAVKRFQKQGKDSILIVVPNDKIGQDFIDFAVNMKLTIKLLDGIKDNGGSGISITTYANFYQNESLLEREFDLVVFDESHKINSNAAGDDTRVQDMMRKVTGHPNDMNRRLEVAKTKEPLKSQFAEIDNKIIAINQKYGNYGAELQERINNGGGYNNVPESAENEKYELRKDILELEKTAKEELLAKRSKVLFLSATPFAYEKSIDYAEGYLFDYNKVDGSGYNSGGGYEQFMMANFGGTMRYNKLTRTDAGVDTGYMQREFNEKLKKSGALSGRALKVEADYSREFIILKDRIGEDIDAALEVLRQDKYKEFGNYINVTSFNYMRKLMLLEAIKAKSVVKRIKKHIALGRKVVVFHGFNAGVTSNPFRLDKSYKEWNALNRQGIVDDQAALFEADYPQYYNMKFNDLHSPIDTFKKAFGGDVMIYNGKVTSKKRQVHTNDFNDDSQVKDVILMQTDAGKEGVSLHDTTGNKQRVLINLGLPTKPTDTIQIEGRIYRTGQITNAVFEYISTGTQYEKRVFADVIATRSSTAENLAMGNDARNLLDDFKNGYINATSDEPNLEQGTGGKSSTAAAELSPFDKAKSDYFATQKANKNTKAKGVDYFPTPEPIGLKMVELAGLKRGESALEPSAGHGAIARYFPDFTDNTFVEPSGELQGDLALRCAGGNNTIKGGDFESLHAVNKFDGIVMNPPFGKGGKMAIEHLEKACNHLRDGGRVVALIPHGGMADKRLNDFYGRMEEKNIHLIKTIYLPSVAFERAGTSVNTKIVILDRIDDEQEAESVYPSELHLQSETNINELFDSLEHSLSVPDRKMTAVAAKDKRKTEDKPVVAKAPFDDNDPRLTKLFNSMVEVGLAEKQGGYYQYTIKGRLDFYDAKNKYDAVYLSLQNVYGFDDEKIIKVIESGDIKDYL